MKKTIIILLCVFTCNACATIFNGSRAKIVVENNNVKEAVNLTVDDKRYYETFLPAEVRVKRGFKASVITAQAEGYETSTVVVRKTFNPISLGNIIIGGIPGFGVDAATGALMKPEYNRYFLDMKPLTDDGYNQNNNANTFSDTQKDVINRVESKPYATENNIIRWYFDSDPRGARIYWRVVSNIPSVIRNTNETYLMTTPFEETRAFNIKGLTYDNAQHVQIEIKVSKKGYEDQIKRFNVKQAIDQQEISGFFELVPKENNE